VPAQGKLPTAHEAPPTGQVRVTGLIRETQDAAPFTPKPDVAGRIWYGRDPAAMAAALGVQLAAPFILTRDAGTPGEAPEGGHTRLTFRNDHLSYAITWFALAATLLVIYFAFHLSQGRLQVRGPR
jgi:surfeit locus 1 family protein